MKGIGVGLLGKGGKLEGLSGEICARRNGDTCDDSNDRIDNGVSIKAYIGREGDGKGGLDGKSEGRCWFEVIIGDAN